MRAAFADLRAYWDGLLGVLRVDTPDTDSNRMVSIWNAYQCMVTFNMSRSVSSYETGISRGMGFRDSCQDLLGAVQLDGPRARQRILDLAATQFASGGAYHQYQPLTKTGNDAIGSGFNDDPLWLVLGVAAYLKETGDTTDPRRAASRSATRAKPPSTATWSGPSSTPSTGSARTACRSSAAPTGTTA